MQQVIIIGAPRSGTNMLRDWLSSVDGIGTWPCDEINYIWRHGNVRFSSDAFTADMATPAVSAYIRKKFQWVADHYGVDTVLEKTCANSLRVEFVEHALDSPKYIFIYRNGLDAVASAMKRWKAELDFRYIFEKARFVPVSDLPYYAFRYLGIRLSRLWSREGKLSSWGPVLPGMDLLQRRHDLAEICALQWQACVERSLDAFENIPADRVLRVGYEDLVRDKKQFAGLLADFVGVESTALETSPFLARISVSSVGKGESQLPTETAARVSEIIGPTRKRLGYP